MYSPDGNYIAYHSQATAGYEADLWRLMLYDRKTGKSEDLTGKFDRSAQELAWSPDSKTIYFTAENETLSADLCDRTARRRAAEENCRRI